jgi:hypothetical protein
MDLEFYGLSTKTHPKKIPCFKRYKNSTIFWDEKVKCRPWIIKIWMKNPNMNE